MNSGMSCSTLAALVLALIASGCGGKVVLEGGSGDGGAGGMGGAASSSTSQDVSVGDTVSVTNGTGVSCDTLLANMQDTLDAATACNACTGFDGCVVGVLLHDACGCDVQGNGSLTDEPLEATQAYNEWVAAGCGPFACNRECGPVSSKGFCAPDGSGTCQGHCAGG